MISVIRIKIERFNYACFNSRNKTNQYLSISKLLEYCVDRRVEQAVEQLKQHFWDARDEIKVLL